MKLYNSLSKTVEESQPLKDSEYRIYSCGPTVYNNLHIGNLSSFIYADTLRRVLALEFSVKHVMNITDVDDKTIRDSKIDYPDLEPSQALTKLTSKYTKVFLDDMTSVGNNMEDIELIKATDSIDLMTDMIKTLYDEGVAYIGADGIYFSIAKYREEGKSYGVLTKIDPTKAISRITSDEYDNDQIADFALWKFKVEGEPSWPLEIAGEDYEGRPGWHIECSAMSKASLGQPFDIHTGGIDLKFPHHENEIAQSEAASDSKYCLTFFHNEHLLVNGAKMSKSKHNFYTLRDVESKGYEPTVFRLVVLQSHYRSQLDFSWDSMDAAKNRLGTLRAIACLRHQPVESAASCTSLLQEVTESFIASLEDDLGTPLALAALAKLDALLSQGLKAEDAQQFESLLSLIDQTLGLGLMLVEDINPDLKELLDSRNAAKQNKDWQHADKARDMLKVSGVAVKDLKDTQLWYYL